MFDIETLTHFLIMQSQSFFEYSHISFTYYINVKKEHSIYQFVRAWMLHLELNDELWCMSFLLHLATTNENKTSPKNI